MYKKILLAVDDNPARQLAADHAIALASLCGSELIIMSAVKPERRINRNASGVADADVNYARLKAEKAIAAVVQRAEQNGISASGKLVETAPAQGILQAIKDFEPNLVVMTPHRLTLFGVPLSRTTSKVIKYSPVPVLLIHLGMTARI